MSKRSINFYKTKREITGSKQTFFSTQEVGKKMTFSQDLPNLHDFF